jgi:hypothetical protein
MRVPGHGLPHAHGLSSGPLAVALVLTAGLVVLGVLFWAIRRTRRVVRPRHRGDRAVQTGVVLAVILLIAGLAWMLHRGMLPR